MSQALVAEHGGEVPPRMEALVRLPGVGRKTANVVLGHALGVPGLPVDRHVLRVTNRIGLAASDDPEVVEQQLGERLPRDAWTRASDTLILHGRRICKPKPLCDRCAVRDACDYFRRRSARAIGRRAVLRHGRKTAAGRLAGRSPAPSADDDSRTVPPARELRRSTRFRRASGGTSRTSRSWSRTNPPPPCSTRWRSKPPDTLFGLYQGTPLTERRWDYGNVLPDRIVLFQGPIEDVSETEDDVVTEIGETLIHEVGHYFGLSEEEIEEIEDRYWDRRQEAGAGAQDDERRGRGRRERRRETGDEGAQAVRPALPRAVLGRPRGRRHRARRRRTSSSRSAPAAAP